ncbi:hypothetical protein ACOME3_006610 [Neoechinorhynchus agilis]
MNGERGSDNYSTLIDVALKKCFERVTETLKDSLIEMMTTVKDILTEAIECEKEALKSEQLIEVRKYKGKKANGSKRQSKPVVLYDSNITVEEHDIVIGIKGNDRKKESDPAEVITKKAAVGQKVQVTPEQVVTRAKGGTPSKSINHPIHFGSDTPSPPLPSSLAALNSTHRIMHSSLDDRNRTIFIPGMSEAPVADPVADDAHNRHQILRIGQFISPTFTLLFLLHQQLCAFHPKIPLTRENVSSK